MKFPKKTKNALTGVRGERAFIGLLPQSWGVLKHDSDYGADYMLEIWNEEDPPRFVARDVAIQVKSHSTNDNVLDWDRMSYYEGILPKANIPKEKLKSSTLDYLCNSSAYLVTMYFDRQFEDAYRHFCDLFEPGVRSLALERHRSSPSALNVVSWTPLRVIRSFLSRQSSSSDSAYVDIPILPQSVHLFPHSEEDPRGDGPKVCMQRNEYSPHDSRGKHRMIFHASWKEMLIDTLSGGYIDDIMKIRYAPYFVTEPGAFLKSSVRKAGDLWTLTEAFVASYYLKGGDVSWVATYLDLLSPFLSFIILRVCRRHGVIVSPEQFHAYCRAEAIRRRNPDQFLLDPYDDKHGKAYARRYYDEPSFYLRDLLEYEPSAVVDILDYLLRADDLAGIGEFFGQLTYMPEEVPRFGALAHCVEDRLLTAGLVSTAHHSRQSISNVIGGLQKRGIPCFDFSPREW